MSRYYSNSSCLSTKTVLDALDNPIKKIMISALLIFTDFLLLLGSKLLEAPFRLRVTIKMLLFLLGSVFFRFVGAPDTDSSVVINELNQALQIELNVFIDFEDFGSSNTLFNLDTPKIQLTLECEDIKDFRIRGHFTERALIIVKLKDSGLDHNVADFLPNLLDELHELNIVFLSTEEPVFLKEDLFTYSYKQGFVNVILIYGKDLYGYLPYPSIQPIKLSNISEYLDTRRIIRNFRGYPIRTIRTKGIPRDFEYFNGQNELVQAGYLFAAVKEFTYRYNATLISKESPKGSNVASYLAIAEMLSQKEIDIICFYKELGWPVASTVPLSIVNYHLMVPHAIPISSYFYYSRPFTWTLWLVIACTVFYGSLTLHLSSRKKQIDVSKCLLYSLSHILYTCHEKIRNTGWRATSIHIILTSCGFILTNLYLSTLSSILTSGLYEQEYDTLEDLAKSPFISLHDEFHWTYFTTFTFLPEALRRNSMSLNVSIVTAYRDGLNKSYMYWISDDRIEMVLRQQELLKKPRFYKLSQPVGYSLESYCVSRSLPYLEMASEFMRRLQEHGINIKMRADTFQVLIQQGIYTLMRDDEPPAKAFDLEFYFFAFGLWTLGMGLSFVVFLGESF
ncbi:uncharacterized protein LOC108144140 [Drosophila elegans]|uniref:uncharacterized protein LOC108144140 n=1 Tax=Drosophila elegans TaxID=30023 RepID=UPI001BC83D4C|nr:uncharacterized protein LOC108144140 [Drosophila elegans]